MVVLQPLVLVGPKPVHTMVCDRHTESTPTYRLAYAVNDTTVDRGPPMGKSLLAATSAATTAEAVDKCVVMVMVVAVWALTVTSGANGHLGTDGRLTRRDKTGGRSMNATGSRSICLPRSSGDVSDTDA